VHFGPNLQGFRPGVNLACLSEAMLLALEADYTDHSIGQDLTLEEAGYIRSLAQKHGMRLAPFEWHRKPVTELDFERVRLLRRGQPSAPAAVAGVAAS
jgi:hypothetical protein